MIEDMHEYGVYTDAVDIAFDVDELEDSDVDEDEHANENNTHHHTNMTNLQRQHTVAEPGFILRGAGRQELYLGGPARSFSLR